eukprot:GGOE01032524.1.p1 GENE.GGOE01032524.1~~GGOE01032524.1.p1  ORF type:complete len:290 (+),score=60.95 GGOE01032524.1:243-1112(+)
MVPPPVTQSRSWQSISSFSSQGGRQSLLTVRKVTYLLVQFNFNQHQSTIGQVQGNLTTFLSHLVDTAKAQGGTLGNVSHDRAVVHWGASRRAIAEAPMHAVETAIALTSFYKKLHGGAELQLNIAIGCGNSTTGVVETVTNSFFVVCGGQVPLIERIISQNWKATLGVSILITDTVRTSVQYTHVCHPRLVDGEEVLWEPLAQQKEKRDDEWMYQLQENIDLTPTILLGPFNALCKGEFLKASPHLRCSPSAPPPAFEPHSAGWFLTSTSISSGEVPYHNCEVQGIPCL